MVALRCAEIRIGAIRPPVFDERQHDLVEFAAAKAEGQQPAVFTFAQGQGVPAIAGAGAAPVVALAPDPRADGLCRRRSSSCPRDEIDAQDVVDTDHWGQASLRPSPGLGPGWLLLDRLAGAGADAAAKSGGAAGGATVGVRSFQPGTLLRSTQPTI